MLSSEATAEAVRWGLVSASGPMLKQDPTCEFRKSVRRELVLAQVGRELVLAQVGLTSG